MIKDITDLGWINLSIEEYINRYIKNGLLHIRGHVFTIIERNNNTFKVKNKFNDHYHIRFSSLRMLDSSGSHFRGFSGHRVTISYMGCLDQPNTFRGALNTIIHPVSYLLRSVYINVLKPNIPFIIIGSLLVGLLWAMIVQMNKEHAIHLATQRTTVQIETVADKVQETIPGSLLDRGYVRYKIVLTNGDYYGVDVGVYGALNKGDKVTVEETSCDVHRTYKQLKLK